MDCCPNCQTKVEPFEVNCHKCGHVLSLSAVPVVDDVPVPSQDLDEAFRSWFGKGKGAMSSQRYEEAAACFHEALKRARALEQATEKEVQVRRELAEALEKDDKFSEAAEQYIALSKMTENAKESGGYSQKAKTLDGHAESLAQSVEFHPVSRDERILVALYCAQCKRLLSEAEVYGYRKGVVQSVRCLCGAEDIPVTLHDRKYERVMIDVQSTRGRKAKLLEAAGTPIPGGKRRSVAAILAVLLGNFGAHKIYLGERDAGFVYLLFCWSFLPWIVALFEAVQYSQMSLVTFNLNYNVEQVIARIPPEPEKAPAAADIFSMEITEDPEDFVDEFTTPRPVS